VGSVLEGPPGISGRLEAIVHAHGGAIDEFSGRKIDVKDFE
jgi:hypothetical protein